ncbi:GYDIA family GHMP kinase [Lewinella sp. IMCC34191]|uniref:GYDIA family GHMP kinase n=1 Tax=Lewinella sp. IMCC34191 TaxID=2259172 RepID=UPI000E2242D1|nr:GYDIA family GHMP kinase [Lewinella sp. IMCC34191]
MQETKEFYGHGKLLLTGEYFVLDGATALAAPTRQGQRFRVRPMLQDSRYDLIWRMHVPGQSQASTFSFTSEDWSHTHLSDDPIRSRLQQLFYAAEQLRPRCTVQLLGQEVDTELEFPTDWGLGSSSTLVWFLARFLEINAYDLLRLSFNGSGYDVACAGVDGPIMYQRRDSDPIIKPVHFRPDWAASSCFVHRNKKQNSREGIAKYREAAAAAGAKDRISGISKALLDKTSDLRAAASLLEEHEQLIGETLGLSPVKDLLFADFDGTVKSLGAWGGDFVWVLSERPATWVRDYFNERGYPTVIAYNDMLL